MNFFELDISYFQRASQLSFQEILFLGVFHGIIFSLPFSAPLLICFRRFLLDGFKMGTVALTGTLFGQLSFLFFIFLGFRPLIQFWYLFEPFLAFLGMSLALKLATDFFHQKNWRESQVNATARTSDDFSSGLSSRQSGGSFFDFLAGFGKRSYQIINAFLPKKGNLPSQFSPEIRIFCFQFLLMFLNPAFPATSTRLILGQDLLDGFWGGASFAAGGGFHFGFTYAIGFIFGSLLCVSCFVLILHVLFVQLSEARVAITQSGTAPEYRGDRSFFSAAKLLQFANPLFLNKAFVFLIIGCILQGTVQYSWRLFTQYPLDFIGWQTTENISEKASSPVSLGSGSVLDTTASYQRSATSFQREFPSFDSNIRHRDKNLPLERHIPVEKVNARRTLSGRPPLNEEQKSDAYLKYNSFFLNKIEQSIEDAKIRFRTPNVHVRTYEDMNQLQKMKERYLKAQALESGYSMATSQLGSSPLQLEVPYLLTKAHPLENTTKGKPKLSYIRELIEKRALAPARSAGLKNGSHGTTAFAQNATSQDTLYVHDDLQIYNALFKLLN